MALSYAEYLNPKLALEVRGPFLRHKAGDPTLADETLQRSTAEGNEWVARRALARVVRNEYTGELHKRGVEQPLHYVICTNETYLHLFGRTAKQLKQDRGITTSSGNLRDKLSLKKLAFVAASEALSVERMGDENASGFRECKTATAKASSAIKNAIDADRQDRQGRLA